MAYLRKVTIANGSSIDANIIALDSSANELIYLSAFGYDSHTKFATKNINKKNTVYIEGRGSYQTESKAYNVLKSKDPNSDYYHVIAFKKDKVVDSTNDKILFAYLYLPINENEYDKWDIDNDEKEIPEIILNTLYDKLNKQTPVPLLKEWMPYILRKLTWNFSSTNIYKDDNIKFQVLKLRVPFLTLFNIVSEGLSDGELTIDNCNSSSEMMREDVTGLDSYLNSFSEILANKIQESFKPKFIPKIDTYSEQLLDFKDYASYKGLNMYDAQLAVSQATANHLKNSEVGFIIGEMGQNRPSLMETL